MSEEVTEVEPDGLPDPNPPAGDEPAEEESKKVEASIWRLGRLGLMLSSVPEDNVTWLAEQEMGTGTIFFYAELGVE